METDRRQLLAQVASWYYLDGESLAAIATRLERSVSRASRLLQEARDENLVEIRIRWPLEKVSAIEQQLQKRFALAKCTVFNDPDEQAPASSLERFGRMAATEISQGIIDGQTIAIGWGAHVQACISAVSLRERVSGLVVQACGAVGANDASVDGARLAHMLAERLGMKSRSLHSPLIVDDATVASALRNSPSIKQSLSLAQSADLVLIGLGSLEAARSGMHIAGYVTKKQLQALKKQGSVGDLGGYHLTADGNVLNAPINDCVIGLHPEQIRQMPNVVILATGIEKTRILTAALHGGYIDHLITNQTTAQAVLDATPQTDMTEQALQAADTSRKHNA